MDWARYTSSTLAQVNDLEMEFLDCIQYDLHVSKEEYELWTVELWREVQEAVRSKWRAHKRASTGKAKSSARHHHHVSNPYTSSLRFDSRRHDQHASSNEERELIIPIERAVSAQIRHFVRD
ncbi:hypothetical protein K493DRAFT_315127 [Basidiobolus meristosporus CBS 931.73]|uniref:Uncharacterized protein n=1 Tax=Basidiobolus meristosporus CBS 931.73 TaxID=1314790 RepID=A0A1Y1YBP5_9FUNG|nr:hypothetical protein K493DRAFT_315127 [Basidiobolus meristosporus CBS 931.73]|eukprot:ORX95186.1 hypothetical protein K493DRAFT_315127 [Basidiobolus meristosporus CBS 931.73]